MQNKSVLVFLQDMDPWPTQTAVACARMLCRLAETPDPLCLVVTDDEVQALLWRDKMCPHHELQSVLTIVVVVVATSAFAVWGSSDMNSSNDA